MNTAMMSEKPFLFQDFQNAFNTMKNALNQKHSYMLMLGESGSGKTTLLRLLKQDVDKNYFEPIYFSNTIATPARILTLLAKHFHLPLWCSRVEIANLVTATLKIHDKRILLIIDDAQSLHDDTLHELRLLCEADLNGTPLFSVILSALPTLKEKLQAAHLFPLLRRISIRSRLNGIQHEECKHFVNHVLHNKAHRFSPEALSLIFEHAKGLPALIKSYCEDALRIEQNQKIIQKKQVIEIFDTIDSF